MPGSTPETLRHLAWDNAKAAVRAYARDPSDSNAAQVEALLARAREVGSEVGDSSGRGPLGVDDCARR